jgi:hypothetical protein
VTPDRRTGGERDVTDWRAARTREHRDTSLGFAVRLVDAFTGDGPTGDVRVALADVDATPVENPSGYHVFLELPVETVTLVVDGGDRYFDETRRVVLSDEESATADAGDGDPPTVVLPDRSTPAVVELTPTPAYGFPATATTVRGHVEDANGDPVEGATVRLREFDPVTRTTATGEFALFVPVTAEDVVREGDAKHVRVDGRSDPDANGPGVANGGTGRDPTLVVSHPSYADVEERIAVAGGTRTVRYVTLD